MNNLNWPQAILHIDGDAFFASCAQATHPDLKGRPIVTGLERNIVTAASYEAKALGVSRGTKLWQVLRQYPELIALPSDYETYGLFSQRMHAIIRRYTPQVEEYSIDEAFANITNLQHLHQTDYETIARHIQQTIHQELDITVSVGLSLSKTLAKIATKKNKPNGFCAINHKNRQAILAHIPIEDIWNVGPSTAQLLRRHQITTAQSFANAPSAIIQKLLNKPGLQTWQELKGYNILSWKTIAKQTYQSISKTKTFTPPSNNPSFVFSQLANNLENACAKARHFGLATTNITICLRQRDFSNYNTSISITSPTSYPIDILPLIRHQFYHLFHPFAHYRATGIILSNLVPLTNTQLDLFSSPHKITATHQLYQAIDSLNHKYGKHTICHATSLTYNHPQHHNSRTQQPFRQQIKLKGESKLRHLRLPLIQKKLS